jgi:hypothetical protein
LCRPIPVSVTSRMPYVGAPGPAQACNDSSGRPARRPRC